MLTTKIQIDGEDFINFCGLLRKHELYLLGDHPFKTSAFFKGRGVPIADVCLLEGGRGLRNADVCNFYFFCQNIALNA